MKKMKFETKVIHSGLETDPTTGSIITPIYQTSTYVQAKPGVNKGYEYSRTANPTRTALEKSIAEIENGKYAICYSSGMGAADAIIKLLNPGDEIISNKDIYGGTYRMFERVFSRFNLEFKYIDLTKSSNLKNQLSKKTKLIWIETPSNPLMNIIDIIEIKKIIKNHKNIILIVDNTFATPALQNPIDLGADIVLHSATKYLGGHSDLVMGALILNNKKLYEELFLITKSCGAVPGPMDCFLALRGIKTLYVRMQKHCNNAKEIVKYLVKNKHIEKVYWPGLKTHPNHKTAKKQMKDFGGMVSFQLKKNNFKQATKFLSNLKLFKLAESLGGVESLISHPYSMTHASLSNEQKNLNSITEGLIRISIGIENHEDLINDLEKGFKKLK